MNSQEWHTDLNSKIRQKCAIFLIFKYYFEFHFIFSKKLMSATFPLTAIFSKYLGALWVFFFKGRKKTEDELY